MRFFAVGNRIFGAGSGSYFFSAVLAIARLFFKNIGNFFPAMGHKNPAAYFLDLGGGLVLKKAQDGWGCRVFGCGGKKLRPPLPARTFLCSPGLPSAGLVWTFPCQSSPAVLAVLGTIRRGGHGRKRR